MSVPVLGHHDIEALDISLDEVRDVVEAALRSLGDTDTECPRKLSVSGPQSVSYAMLARLGEQGLVGFKTSYTHWTDEDRSRGKSYATSLLLCDEATGQPLAWMDAGRVGALRTSAVTALLARRACTPDTSTALVIGSGTQGEGTIRALAGALPSLKRVLIAGSHLDGLRRCLSAAAEVGLEADPVAPGDVRPAARETPLIIGASGPHWTALVEHEDLAPATTTIIVGSGVGGTCVADADVLVATSAEQMQLTGTDLVAPDGTLRTPDLEFPDALRRGVPLRTRPDQKICCYNSGLVVTDVALGARVARRALEGTALRQKVSMW